jgi:hypothetical protein
MKAALIRKKEEAGAKLGCLQAIMATYYTVSVFVSLNARVLGSRTNLGPFSLSHAPVIQMILISPLKLHPRIT